MNNGVTEIKCLSNLNPSQYSTAIQTEATVRKTYNSLVPSVSNSCTGTLRMFETDREV